MLPPRLLEHVLAAHPGPVLLVDEAGTIRYANAAVAERPDPEAGIAVLQDPA